MFSRVVGSAYQVKVEAGIFFFLNVYSMITFLPIFGVIDVVIRLNGS